MKKMLHVNGFYRSEEMLEHHERANERTTKVITELLLLQEDVGSMESGIHVRSNMTTTNINTLLKRDPKYSFKFFLLR